MDDKGENLLWEQKADEMDHVMEHEHVFLESQLCFLSLFLFF